MLGNAWTSYRVTECSNQPTLGITVFPYPSGVGLQLLFVVAVTKEFVDDLCSVNTHSLSKTKVIW